MSQFLKHSVGAHHVKAGLTSVLDSLKIYEHVVDIENT
jgi:hypothetical protein